MVRVSCQNRLTPLQVSVCFVFSSRIKQSVQFFTSSYFFIKTSDSFICSVMCQFKYERKLQIISRGATTRKCIVTNIEQNDVRDANLSCLQFWKIHERTKNNEPPTSYLVGSLFGKVPIWFIWKKKKDKNSGQMSCINRTARLADGRRWVQVTSYIHAYDKQAAHSDPASNSQLKKCVFSSCSLMISLVMGWFMYRYRSSLVFMHYCTSSVACVDITL